MKNIKNIISFIIMSIVLFSCEDKGLDNQDWLQEPNFANPMTLTLSSKEVVLVEENDAQNAITFTWTQGNDRGAGTSLKYFFRMDILGNNFSKDEFDEDDKTVYTEEIPAGVFSKTYTVKQLNSILLKHFKRPGGAVTNLEVQIIAQVNGGEQFQLPEVSTSSFAVTSYSPGPLPLFMVGDAISGGWDYSTGKSLPEIMERTIYNYAGDFSVGSFKVIEEPGHGLPSYDPVYTVGKENTIVYNETEERTADNVFKVTEAGRYSLYMDIEQKKYVFAKAPYANIYMVGHAIDGIGWDIGKAKPMNWDGKNGVFSYKGKFNDPTGIDKYEGFKLFFKQGDWGAPCLMPQVTHTKLIPDAEAVPMYLNSTVSGDNKWDIEATGNYELIVDPVKMTIKLNKL